MNWEQWFAERVTAREEAGLRRVLRPRRPYDVYAGVIDLGRLPQVSDVRTLGAVGVVQLDHPVDVVKATDAALAEGVWLRPFRDLVYTMPPYISTDDDVARICAGIAAAVQAG